MPLFKCEQCGVVENTACGDYWCAEKKLCSQCSPEIGKWHGRFPRTDAAAAGYLRDEQGFIYAPDEVDLKEMRWKYNRDFKIVGPA